MLVVLVFMGILALWVIAFSRGASHSSWVVFRSEQQEVVKHLLESALAEAYVVIDRESRDPQSALSRWLIDPADRSAQILDRPQLPAIDTAITQLQQRMPLGTVNCSVSVTKRQADFRPLRRPGLPTYYGRQGHGTLIFTGKIVVSRPNKPFLGFSIEQHHDYKVVNLVSRRGPDLERRTAPNLNLDYVLYVREGRDEFLRTKGRMLNRSGLQLSVKPKGEGRIYFGGTHLPSDYIFLNIGPGGESRLPPRSTATRPLSAGDISTLAQRLRQYAPQLRDRLPEAARAGQIPGSAADSPNDLLVRMLTDLKPALTSSHAVIDPASQDARQSYVQAALFGNMAVTDLLEDNAEPGVSLLEDTDDPRRVIEGGIRQRFLTIVADNQLQLLAVRLARLLGTPLQPGFQAALTSPAYRKRCRKEGEPVDPLVHAIDLTLERIPGAPLASSVSFIDQELPYGSTRSADRGSQLRPRSVPESYTPFAYGNLRAFSLGGSQDLKAIGLVKDNLLAPHGASHVRSSIILGENGPLRCVGRGVISSSGDIIIRHGITCEPDALLLLVAKGRIVVQTSEVIEAGLCAHSVSVTAGNAFHLKGSLTVDRLGSAQWPLDQPHCLEYDVARLVRTQDLNAVTVSPRITFYRQMRAEP